MGSKQPVEEFIQDCFRERTEALRRRFAVHQAFRQRFYNSDCPFDSRRGVIEKSEEEKIVDVLLTDQGANVVTSGDTINRSRYRVNKLGEIWLIQDVDYECARCRVIAVPAKCPQCDGTGWWSWNKRATLVQPALRKQPAALVTKEELRGRYFSDADLEEFMAEHFRERIITRRKELEILYNYTRRFYSAECDCSRWGPYGEQSDAETVLGVELAGTGVRVITSGLNTWRLRYHLRPSGHSWLIWDVDTECGICCREGRSTNCILCGGTIWGKRRETRGKRPPSSGEQPPPENPRW